MTDNATLAKRIAELERQLSTTTTTANTLLEENRQLLVEISSSKDELQSSMLSEATAKQYAKEVDTQNAALAAQVDALHKAYEASKFTEYGDKILEKAFATTPQQHLAERDAQKGRDGFIAGVEARRIALLNDEQVAIKANQYADSIRQEK